MRKIEDFFVPFIDQVVWQVRRGHGSFLTMEFGAPHLAVREPIVPSAGTSGKVRRNLLRRHVDITGDWHFWVQYSNWTVSTSNGVLTSCDARGSPSDECLADLDGQRLVSVEAHAQARSSMFKFDLGASLEMSPSAEIPDDQWSVYSWDGDIVSCRADGTLVFDKADLEQRKYRPLRVTWS
jgi:hypothetical protein